MKKLFSVILGAIIAVSVFGLDVKNIEPTVAETDPIWSADKTNYNTKAEDTVVQTNLQAQIDANSATNAAVKVTADAALPKAAGASNPLTDSLTITNGGVNLSYGEFVYWGGSTNVGFGFLSATQACVRFWTGSAISNTYMNMVSE